MWLYLALLAAVIALGSAAESLGFEVRPGVIGIAAGAATILWLSRKKQTTL
ncbi:hypothetical protein [Sphingomonas elodea]|uniref:hypothetical protein n=1 Tax=Sphingomonas elodea TaxID=179878 RepID=UPI001300C007|nr:hypothetical protein [Sphingomonas elodea]